MELAALVIAQKRAAALRAEHEVNDDVGEDWDMGVAPLQAGESIWG